MANKTYAVRYVSEFGFDVCDSMTEKDLHAFLLDAEYIDEDGNLINDEIMIYEDNPLDVEELYQKLNKSWGDE